MRYFLATLAGLLVGAGVIVAVAVAVPRAVQQKPSTSGMPMGATMGSTLMGAVASPATRKLTIQHVQRGCHVWSNGKMTAAMMRLHLKPGQRLSILDMDVDAHQMLQFAGPTHLRMGGPMMMNRGMTLSFPRAGVYRLGTKTVEMPGGMDVKTIGPDNKLRLVVTVA
jgi:hypothetical protein